MHGQSEIIKASEERMIELISNLVDNAIRYNKPNGRVDITVDHDEQGTYLSVKDNGIGIPKRYHDRIFERFYQVERNALRIAMRIVDFGCACSSMVWDKYHVGMPFQKDVIDCLTQTTIIGDKKSEITARGR